MQPVDGIDQTAASAYVLDDVVFRAASEGWWRAAQSLCPCRTYGWV